MTRAIPFGTALVMSPAVLYSANFSGGILRPLPPPGGLLTA